MRYRRWRLYGERGLAGAEAAVWVLGETLSIEYATATLAQYTVAYEPDERHIRRVTAPRLFATQHPSPQPYLAPLEALPWQPALRLPPYRARRARPRTVGPGQAPLFPPDDEQRDEG